MNKVILIVDGKPEVAKIINEQLSCDYIIRPVIDPLKALAWLQEGYMPHLIITDIDMPRMDGMEFLKQLKASPMFCRIPVVVLSGLENNNLRTELMKMGADDFMLKPFNPGEVKTKIEKIVNKKTVLI